MDSDRVFALFCLFVDSSGESLARWKGLCDNAATSLWNQCRTDSPSPADKERLCTTAAAFAYADYLLLSPGGQYQGEQIKVGDISLGSSQTRTENRRDSDSIRRYFSQQIADLLLTPGFVFSAIGEVADA